MCVCVCARARARACVLAKLANKFMSALKRHKPVDIYFYLFVVYVKNNKLLLQKCI
jgi:hypothetical protein